MKLLLDEMWSPEVATQLQLRGHDVIAVVALAHLRSQPDVVIFAVAQSENRTVVTDNVNDFRGLAINELNRSGDHAGLILTNNRSLPRHVPRITGKLVRALNALLSSDLDVTNLEFWLPQSV